MHLLTQTLHGPVCSQHKEKVVPAASALWERWWEVSVSSSSSVRSDSPGNPSIWSGVWCFLSWNITVRFFLCEFWQFVSFKELVFTWLIKFVGIKLFILFLYYPSNVHCICSDVPAFISDVNLSLLNLFFATLLNLQKSCRLRY